MKAYIKALSQKLFSSLESGEVLSLYVHSEESTFVRFNHSKVRQNINVNQHELTLGFQKNHKNLHENLSLTLNLESDLEAGQLFLELTRKELTSIDEDPYFVARKNGGLSETINKSIYPSDIEVILEIADVFSDSDMVGIWRSGPIRKISVNSLGQFHFFEMDAFSFDYSVYNGPRAAKGYYASENWNSLEFKNKAKNTKNALSMLLKQPLPIPPGKYRVYLEPMAVLEILDLFRWSGPLSTGAYHQGSSSFRSLIEKKNSFSPLFSLSENFKLGFSPIFNSLGECSVKKIELIREGKLVQLLTSTASASEYKVESNNADVTEMPRSLDLHPGTLKESDILKKLDRGIYISNLHYLNWSDRNLGRITGMTRFGCFWVKNGEIQGPIQDLRFDDSVYHFLGDNLMEVGEKTELFIDVLTYRQSSASASRTPGLLIQDFQFTL